jgi:predicted  nucleic acid-binding Zn-ribbon protein
MPAPNSMPSPPRRNSELDAVISNLSEVASSLRVLEDKYTNLRKKIQLTDQNLLDIQKSLFKEKKLLTEELTDAKMKLQELMDDLLSMKSELKDTVKHNDLKVLDRYLDMWEPLQYVTRKEAENAIEQLKKEQNE